MAIKGKSKFDYDVFIGGFNGLMGFNKQMYTKESALKVWRLKQMLDEDTPYIIEDAFVRYRFVVDEDNEPCNGWWLEWRDHGHKSVPVWSIMISHP
ncbi:hypothetical protein QQG09_08310 [Melissococcus plutonius]|uniref:hypothetical protein n=1 Tax=Melissococcus plutonius TaxID=33970 RepID=UPI0021E5F7EA|nr:hypothetical protein [Melissococcus plutonius]MCV2520381.1 hypothetical protein [Melissococcus plutonius]